MGGKLPTLQGPAVCDSQLSGWYRIHGGAGTKMPTSCVPKNRCKTNHPGWLNGNHPTVADGQVTRQVCFRKNSDCCKWYTSIKVRNCGDYFVYLVNGTPNSKCNLRYCSTGWSLWRRHLFCIDIAALIRFSGEDSINTPTLTRFSEEDSIDTLTLTRLSVEDIIDTPTLTSFSAEDSIDTPLTIDLQQKTVSMVQHWLASQQETVSILQHWLDSQRKTVSIYQFVSY